MTANIIDSMSEKFDITPETAREILLHYTDQPPQCPDDEYWDEELGRCVEGEPPGPDRPPARKVDPWWYGIGLWNYATDPIWITMMTTGVAGYTALKGYRAAQAGLTARAALPKILGGMTSGELKSARTVPEFANAFKLWYGAGRPGRGWRPAMKLIQTGPRAGQSTLHAPIVQAAKMGKIPAAGGLRGLAARAGGRLFGAVLPLGVMTPTSAELEDPTEIGQYRRAQEPERKWWEPRRIRFGTGGP